MKRKGYERRRIERERHFTDPIITEDELRLAKELQLRMKRLPTEEDEAKWRNEDKWNTL